MEYTLQSKSVSQKINKFNNSKTNYVFEISQENYNTLVGDFNNIGEENLKLPVFGYDSEMEEKKQKLMGQDRPLLMATTIVDEKKSFIFKKDEVYNVTFLFKYYDFNGKKGISCKITNIE